MPPPSLFILFGLWSIRVDELNNEDKRFSFSPFWTVAIAFFIIVAVFFVVRMGKV